MVIVKEKRSKHRRMERDIYRARKRQRRSEINRGSGAIMVITRERVHVTVAPSIWRKGAPRSG